MGAENVDSYIVDRHTEAIEAMLTLASITGDESVRQAYLTAADTAHAQLEEHVADALPT